MKNTLELKPSFYTNIKSFKNNAIIKIKDCYEILESYGEEIIFYNKENDDFEICLDNIAYNSSIGKHITEFLKQKNLAYRMTKKGLIQCVKKTYDEKLLNI